MKVYIEAGANDGVFQSRTLKYKNDPEWMGILIEPDPRCLPDLKANRGNDSTKIIWAALIPYDYPKLKVTLKQHHASAMNIIDAASPADGEHYGSEVEVPAATLDDILSSLGNINIIDELYLDVEGYELQVMQGISTDVVIKFAEIECHHHKGPNAQQEIDDHVENMKRFNMELVRIDTDSGHPKLIFQLIL